MTAPAPTANHDRHPLVPVPGPPSWWQLEHPSPGWLPLRDHVEADVCIVGGGVSGCSAAWHLARAGARVLLLEAREVAGGASGRNGGFLLAGLHVRYETLRERLGSNRTRALYELTALGRDQLLATATTLGLGDAARRTGSLRLAIDAGEVGDLEREAALLHNDGFAGELLRAPELPVPLADHFLVGLRFPDDGASQPAAWVRGLAAAASSEGALLCEHSPVVALERDGDGRHLVRTSAGYVVRAGTVIACTEAWLPGLVPELRGHLTPYRSQVLATAPPPGGAQLLPCPVWSRRGWDYAQQAAGGELIVGGEQVEQAELYATWEEATDAADQAALEAWVERVLGWKPEVLVRWAGVLSNSFDGLPLLGPLAGREGVLICGGWGGAGNVLGFVGGGLVSELVLDRDAIPEEFQASRIG